MSYFAVVLAAGFGSRMKEYTQHTPKPMLKINGLPLAEYIIRQLMSCGISDIGLNLHYHADQITSYFGTGEKWKAKLHFVYEDQPTGTAGGAKALKDQIQKYSDFILIYGDILTDFNFKELMDHHSSHGKMATVCLHRRSKSNSIVEFDDNKLIHQFIERPSEEELKKYSGQEFWVNSAIYAFKTEILDLISSDQKIVDFPKDIFPNLVKQGQLVAHPISCNRIAIDTEDRYLEAQNKIKQFKFSW